MARLVTDPNETWEFILPEDRTPDGGVKPGQPVFYFGHLSRLVRQHIENSTIVYQLNDKGPEAKADALVKTGDRYTLAVKFALRDVKIDGKTPEWFKTTHHAGYNQTAVSDKTLDVLRMEIPRLGAEAWEKQRLTPEEEENFVPPAE
jgi:hypothetical protein